MFKQSFKYYKSRNPPPDLQDVLDFRQPENFSSRINGIDIVNTELPPTCTGLISPQNWIIYELIEHPGLIYIKNPFTSIAQRYWTVRCLQDFSKKTNKNNLDMFNLVPDNREWWEFCQSNTNKCLLNKLRWVTLGYHHNWDTKIYSEDNRGEFPQDLAILTEYITEILGFPNFKAEAAIVNYYHMDSTLSGHVDNSEQNFEAPLISLSFGQTAIFLLGNKNMSNKPTALFLRSGDIVIMSQESRLCYHGVPKILQMDSRFWDCFDSADSFAASKEISKETANICKDETLWKPFGEYLGYSRININVRQVLKRGQSRLFSESEEN